MSRASIVCAGAAAIDVKLRLDAPAVLATSNPGRMSSSHGGVARNVAENLARFEPAVMLVSAVGLDGDGAAIRDRLGDLGVDVDWLDTEPELPTARYVAVLGADGDLVIGVADMAMIERIGAGHLDNALQPAGPGALLFADCNLGTGLLAHVLRLGRAGRRVGLDMVSTAKATRLPGDLSGAQLLFCNRDEATAWLAAHGERLPDDDAGLVARLHAAGAGAVVLGRGADGVLLHDADGPRALPAVPAEVVDVTGAGDALVAGILSGVGDGRSLDESALIGLGLASLTVASPLSSVPLP